MAQTLSKKYDVFISFRGEDTRSNFTSHLYDAFCKKHIKTFIDYQLPKGDDISPSLLQAIEDSYISVVVFSENYASSRWCLDELTHIIHCKRVQGQIVVPVFYKVEPSHVRNQSGVYEKAFERYESDPKMQLWKKSLNEAANLAGYDYHTFRDESELIQKIVKDILQKLTHKYPPAELKGLVGIDDNCTQTESLLREAKTIGIWGMGGIGKSTIAKTIFSKHSSHYEGSCFLENVREKYENGRADELRHKLLSSILNEDIYIDSSTTFLESRLSRMKVFVVLDDISTGEQLEYLVGEPHCFGEGSKILITTRDKHVLISKGVDIIYKFKELNLFHSYKLFNLNAFKTDCPVLGYKELTDRVIVYAKGIPLALKVLGLYLRGRSEVEWRSALRKLEKSPHQDIQKVLRLSYDGLDDEEKKIFLDIACFLKGWLKESVIYLLDRSGFQGVDIGMRTLHDKALINIDDGEHVEMHDLIQEMGLQVVREESIDEPERRSGLWDSEEIYDFLSNTVGSNKVQGIKLNVSQIRSIRLKANIFKKMPNLRYLIFYSALNDDSSHVDLPKGLKYLPYKLRYLEWHRFPLKYLPSTFCPEKLVKLSMPKSRLKKLWKGKQDFVSLQEIDLSGSERLQELPNLSKCLNLKVVRLRECKRLCDVHSSILSLHSLVELDLFWCKKLKSLKSNFHLKSLQHINVNLCWNLKEFSVSSAELRKLSLVNTNVEILHKSIGLSTKLEELNLSSLRFVDPPIELSCLTSLTVLRLHRCEVIDDLKLQVLFDGMVSLRDVDLSHCHNIIELPSNAKHLSRLKFLNVACCTKLRSLSELPLSILTLTADNCKSLEIVSTWRSLSGGQKRFSFMNCVKLNEQSLHNITEAASYSLVYYVPHENMYNRGDFCSINVPGSHVPKLFKYRKEEQSSIIVEVPQISELADFFFCFVLGFHSVIEHDISLKCICYYEGFEVIRSERKVNVLRTKSDHVFIWNYAFFIDLEESDIEGNNIIMNQQLITNMKLCFEFSVETMELSKLKMKECGVCPVYVSERQEFIQQMEMERKRKKPQDVDEEQPPLQLKKFQVLMKWEILSHILQDINPANKRVEWSVKRS